MPRERDKINPDNLEKLIRKPGKHFAHGVGI